MHKLFMTRCDLGEQRMVTALDCGVCPHGSVIDNKSRVICAGETKFFSVPCGFDMRAAATVRDCEACPWGEVGPDRARVFCGRL